MFGHYTTGPSAGASVGAWPTTRIAYLGPRLNARAAFHRVFWQAGISFIFEILVTGYTQLWQERRDKIRAQFWQVWPKRRDKNHAEFWQVWPERRDKIPCRNGPGARPGSNPIAPTTI